MKRLECLDGLRGMLAVYVLLGHMAPFAALPAGLQSLVSHGGAAVDLFFVLSGLVISLALERPGLRARSFLAARFARIFPVFVPVFLFAVAIQPASCGFAAMPWIGRDSPARTICSDIWPDAWAAEIAAHLTMTHGLFPDAVLPDVWVSLLGAAWSLSTEWQFYLLALLLAQRPRALVWVLLALAAGGAAWRAAGPEAWQFSRAFLANKGHFFALGAASLPLVRREAGALSRYGIVLSACLALCVTTGAAGKLLPPLAWTVCLGAVLWPGAPGWRLLAGAMRWRAAQYLGAISYCVYLVNEPVHKVLAGAVTRAAGGDPVVFTALWLPVSLLLPIAISVLLHRFIEAPAMRRERQKRAGAHGLPLPD